MMDISAIGPKELIIAHVSLVRMFELKRSSISDSARVSEGYASRQDTPSGILTEVKAA